MLVGKIVTIHDLVGHLSSVDDFREFSNSLIPDEFKHVSEIRSNQLYVNLLVLRSSTTIDWQTKKKIIDELMPTIKVVGYTNQLIEVKTLLNIANKSKLLKYRRSDK